MQQLGKALRNPTLWGAGLLAIFSVVALVAAWLYVTPPGQKTVVFYTHDAASLRPGEQVRIAGITVGKVKDLLLESDRVRVRTRVDNDAFVGNRSQVQVRMLTVVGGYYVDIVSLGERALGNNPIPLERVTMPYNLMRTLSDSTKLTENVDPKPINESLNEIQQGLTGPNLKSVAAIIDAGNSLMSTIDKQRGQITAILNLSDEYIRALSDYGDELKQLVQKISILEETLVIYGAGFGSALKGMGDVLDKLEPVGTFYLNHRDLFLEKVRNWTVKARMWADRSGVIVRALRVVRNKIERVLDAQNAAPELLATDLCFPLPEKPC
ncbi:MULTISPECIES: MlaD family protein [Mycobacterium avium complex (MAC)]|uniref:MlaD family protein n=1 Tax=Mycobacterium avium complex (MAC) TaxID=120793 RepID=UPI0007EB5658|nr:MlaD family protein [Mycobacterium intracellulare]ASW87735.1 MCE family protein [Mycobacterium intracellulare]MEE3801523.1 MlaD family protein [Mycobacterium intracellulare]OBG13795.1 mammalian cell entry protein [Mycobacterium intracellulare]UQB87035.1 MCE family protein [Mycobacterium intracellulare]WVL05470.1 MlaD family protein [Mycobacterium intracellulare]